MHVFYLCFTSQSDTLYQISPTDSVGPLICCISCRCSRLTCHKTFTLLPRTTRLNPCSQRTQRTRGGGSGGWVGGAPQHRFEVQQLKRKDLSNWDDGPNVEREGGSVRGTGKAVHTESFGPPRDTIKSKAFLVRVTKTQQGYQQLSLPSQGKGSSRHVAVCSPTPPTHGPLAADKQPHANHFHPSGPKTLQSLQSLQLNSNLKVTSN